MTTLKDLLVGKKKIIIILVIFSAGFLIGFLIPVETYFANEQNPKEVIFCQHFGGCYWK